VNALLLVSIIAVIYGIVWEFSTEQYLQGFTDAVVPLTAPPEQKVEAILEWMSQGPARHITADTSSLSLRDPQTTLGYDALLHLCGSATNAFVNLAAAGGVRARRLLLLDSNRRSKHVVAEVYLDDRWVVVDPAFHAILRDASGRAVTRDELLDPRIFREATNKVSNYPPSYTFERTAHVRLERIPWVGVRLRSCFSWLWPGWEEYISWTRVLERESLAFTLVVAILFCVFLLARGVLAWYADRGLGINRIRLRHQLARTGVALFRNT
jgi:hypothetical protein